MKRARKNPSPSLQAFISRLDAGEKIRFAALAETSVGQLAQLAGGHRQASPEFALRLVEASRRLFRDIPSRHLSRAQVRPDLWGRSTHSRNRSNNTRGARA
jgi:hypothetical protein